MNERPVHFINGVWKKSSGAAFSSHNPATGELVWEGPAATEKEVNESVEAAQQALDSWSSLPIETRIDFLHHFRHELEQSKLELTHAISSEVGKPLWESAGEVEAMRSKITISIDAFNQRCKELRSQLSNATSITRHKPHGVVAVLGPFNFPGHLPNGHIVPALLAGNTIVLKPSEQAPMVAEIMVQCWDRADLPKGVLNMVQGDREAGKLLVHHPQINGLFFTGSWNAGKSFLNDFSSDPGKILALEMGGNNPLVVWDIQDLKAAAYLTIQSAYITSGQRCTCARRLIIPDNDKGEAFLNHLREMVASIKVGPYTEKPEPFMGPVISEQVAKKLLEAQKALQSRGAVSLIPMHHLKPNTGLITPGLIDVTSVKNREDEEFFGPLLQVIRVHTFDDAIREANNTEYGLASGIFTDNETLYRQFLHSIRAGIINWNTQLTGASSSAPFGGIGKSGNFRPSAYYAADYCAYPVASMETSKLTIPEKPAPGISL